MNKIKSENQILLMLAFYSISKGLWENFRQLWLQDNNFSATSISNIISIGTLVSVLGIMYEIGLRYMFGLSAFFMIFQIGLAYYLIYLRSAKYNNEIQDRAY